MLEPTKGSLLLVVTRSCPSNRLALLSVSPSVHVWVAVGGREGAVEGGYYIMHELEVKTQHHAVCRGEMGAQLSCRVGLSRLLGNRVQYPPQDLICSHYTAGPESTLPKAPRAHALSSGIT